MSNKDSYKRKHRYLDNQITRLEKTNSHNRELITNLKKQKLKLKDKLQTEIKQFGRHDKEFRNALAIGS